MPKLIDRFTLGEVKTPKIWFRYGQWSVLDCGELNKTHPFPDGLFMGWEALDDEGNTIRKNNWNELEAVLTP